jgi:hypothetical protein
MEMKTMNHFMLIIVFFLIGHFGMKTIRYYGTIKEDTMKVTFEGTIDEVLQEMHEFIDQKSKLKPEADETEVFYLKEMS